ncbi:YadA-like family protein [Burkholderia anthina]|uniref:YadA-like family protein n=1 Tax=Burkholderia anthina TaxID=179879 RepID=UPI003C7BC41E
MSTVFNTTNNLGNSAASALGGGATYNPTTGTISAPAYTTYNANGTTSTVNDVGSVIDNINSQGIKYFHANSTAADSQATGTDSVAIGPQAIASATSSLAAGNGAQAAAVNGLAFGTQSTVSVADGVAIGSGSVSNRPVLSGTGSITVGSYAVPFNTSDRTLLGAVSFGDAANNTYRQLTNVADGTQAQDAVTVRQLAGALASFAVTGQKYFHANSTQADSLAVGTDSVAVGPTTVVNGNNGVGIGNGAIVDSTAPGGVAIGQSASSAQADAIAFGSGATAAGAQSIAQGANASALNAGGVALGSGAQSGATNALALGAGATAISVNSVALGAGSTAGSPDTGTTALYGGTAAGLANAANGVVSVGAPGKERQLQNVAAGVISATSTDAINGSQLFSVAAGVNSLGNSVATSLGGGSTYNAATGAVTANLSYAGNTYGSVQNVLNAISGGGTTAGIKYFHANSTGADSQALGADSVAIGTNAAANNAGDVALGANSTTATVIPTAGTSIGGTSYSFAGAHPTSAVSVGTPGAERQIQNVAAGQLNSTSTDAINGSQLYATNQQVTANTAAIDNMANGGGIKYFHANSTAPDSQATGTDSVAIGGNAQATTANSVALGANSVANANLGLAAYNPGTGTLAGATAVGEVSVGSAGAERRITNVAAGAAPTDAVNVSQLRAVSSQVSQVQNDALLWDPTANGGTGAFSAKHGGTGPNTITNVAAGVLSPASTDAVNGSQLYATNQNVANVTNAVNDIQNGGGIKYFRANSTAADSQAIGTDSVAIGPLAVASGTSSLAAGNGAQAQGANGLALGAQSNVSIAGGVAIGSGSVSDRAVLSGIGSIVAGSHAIPFNTSDRTLLGAVSFGDASGSTYRQLTNVADGTQAQDAVTVRQLAGALSSFAVTGQKYFHANSSQADSLAVGAESVAVGPTTVVNGDNGIGMGNGAVVDATAPGGVAIGQGASSAQADAIALGSGSIAAGAQSIAQGANSTALNAGSIAFGSGAHSSAVDAVALGAGSSATFANSVALGAGSLTTVGALNNYIAYGLSSPQSSAGEVNVGNRQITGLAAGRIGSDAVNVSQLDAVANQLTSLINQKTVNNAGGSFTSGPSGSGSAPAPTGPNASAGGLGAVASGASSTAVGNSSQAAGNGSTAIGVGATATGTNSTAVGTGSNDGGRSGVMSVGSATSARQVVNVAAGTEGTDAVNVNQLNAVSSSLSTSVNNLSNQVSQVQQQVQQTDSMAREGIAATAAMASIPHMDRDSNFAMGVGTATFAGQKAMAVGMQARISENLKATLNGGFSGSQRVVGAGMLYQWK